ncbi:O-methyltransferase [Reyranella sp. CPCC 100927]|uniref:O-methyltransferase n=1 Tax=Reyranella sp. CPCC 100927 TaxID=2599616 RepID=UPI0011B4B5E1|nr:class I SAM-dependent methyltransferase [Reyranella sp. CPCC 100927]TWT11829.1 SAM-dependent methyltransferase [Reyranella sp. CPCC 100927]
MSKRTQITGRLDAYVDANWLRDSDVKRWLREETSKLPGGMMQVAADQGQLMALLARAIGARIAVEVGTFTGYSALCVAEALPPTGKLHACDVSEEWTRVGRRYWNEAGVADRIELHIGPALRSLDELINGGLAGHVDMAFIDANKTDYDAYYERCLRLLRPRGLMLIDNVLWGGSVADPDDHTADTLAVRALNAKLKDDDRIDLGLLPVGDGMTIALKR